MTNEALEDLDKLYSDSNPYFNIAHHRVAAYLDKHRLQSAPP